MLSSAVVTLLRSTHSEIDPKHPFGTNFASRFTKLTYIKIRAGGLPE